MEKLLNYTTIISAQKTVNEIIGILTAHKAKAILMNYNGGGHIESLSFRVQTPQGEIGIRLPVYPDAVLKVMARQNVARRFLNREHAIRVAWRITRDWIRAQMSMIETEQVRLEQVFLHCWIMNSGRTLYEHMVDTKFQLEKGRE